MNKQREEEIFAFWKDNDIYQKVRQKGGKKKFYFLDGPPYATGSIHIGTAWNKILKDVYLRFWRMAGYDVWDQPGYDTHGLPIEKQVEKQLGIKTKPDIEKLGIEKFIQECRNFATKYIDVMSSQFADLGVWMNWANPYLTLNNDYIEGAWHTFKVGYEKGFLYKGFYPVRVCPNCETAVAYNEIEYESVADTAVYVKFATDEKGKYVVVWTTTPWSIPGTVGIMVNPHYDYAELEVDGEKWILAKDLAEGVMKKIGKDYKLLKTIRGKDLEGLKIRNPLNLKIHEGINTRMVLSDQFVTTEEGTGCVTCAPGHGYPADYKVGMENNLPILSPLGMDGKFTDDAGKYAGVFAVDANRKIIDDMKKTGHLILEDKIQHEYPHCWRCSTKLLFMCIPQWFFKVTDIREKLTKENEKVNWQPEWAKERFDNWLENLGDWPISRQRYWGIPLPIWVCKKCESAKVIGSSSELPVKLNDLHRPYIDNVILDCKCGGKMGRIKDVLDVWFDSGLAAWASLGYPKNKDLFKKLWPSDFQTEGPDQIRGWWNSQLITSVITFGEAPFRNILFHGFVLDAHGIKMSKSKGNVVDPFDVIGKYGRDVLRLYLTSSAPWDDFYFKWPEVDDIAKSFIIIENTFNFVKTYVPGSAKSKELNAEDKWILSRLNSLIESATESFRSYSAHKAATEIYNFLVSDFSRWYIKTIRNRVWPAYEGKDRKAAFYTLHEIASKSVLLLAPFCPFLAEGVYQNVLKKYGVKEESVHMKAWPKADKKLIDKKLEGRMDIVKSLVETANAIRHEEHVKARWPLKKITIDCKEDLAGMDEIIKMMCNVKSVEYGKARDGREFEGGIMRLDTKVIEEEALLREVIRKVQETRKKRKMVIEDRIILRLSNCNELEKFADVLKNEVGADQVIFGSANGEVLEFNGKEINIQIDTVKQGNNR